MRLRLIPKIVKQTLFICGVLWMHRASCIMNHHHHQPRTQMTYADYIAFYRC